MSTLRKRLDCVESKWWMRLARQFQDRTELELVFFALNGVWPENAGDGEPLLPDGRNPKMHESSDKKS